MRTFKRFLSENNVKWLKKNVTHIDTSHDPEPHHTDPHAIIDYWADHGAHPEHRNKHTSWIVSRYRKGDFTQNQAEEVKSTLGDFERHKHRLDNPDLTSYKSLDELQRAVDPHVETKSRSEIKGEGAVKVRSTDKLDMYHIKTHEAACKYGASTKWCISSRNNPHHFDIYNKKGPIYTVHNKETGRKMAYVPESSELRDEKDEMMRPEEVTKHFPGVEEWPEFYDHPKHGPKFDKNVDRIHENLKKSPSREYLHAASENPRVDQDHVVSALTKRLDDVGKAGGDAEWDYRDVNVIHNLDKPMSHEQANRIYDHPALGQHKDRVALSFARSRHVTPEIFKDLASEKHDGTPHDFLTDNPHLSEDQYDHLLEKSKAGDTLAKQRRLENLVDNKSTPKSVVDHAVSTDDYHLKHTAMEHPKLDASHEQKLVEDRANHPHLSVYGKHPDTLRRVAKESGHHDYIAKNLKKNKKTPAEVKRSLDA